MKTFLTYLNESSVYDHLAHLKEYTPSDMEIDPITGNKKWHVIGHPDFIHNEDGPALIWPDGQKFWYYYSRWVHNIMIPERLQLVMIKDDPENIHAFKNPTRKTLEIMVEKHPWVLTEKDFTRCETARKNLDGANHDCKDLKEKWSRIGNARKQIGL